MPEKFDNATITCCLGFTFEKNSFSEITWLSWRHRFRKASFSKCFLFTLKPKAGVFNFLQFEKGFSWLISVDGRPNSRNKAPFSWRIGVDGKLNSRNKAAFSWRIGVDGKLNSRNKAAFSWRMSVDGKPNSRNKAPFSWRISVEGRPNRRNKAAFFKFLRHSMNGVWD